MKCNRKELNTMRDHITIYIGYYRNTILAVSPDKKILKQYLKETRKLSPNEYAIRDSYMASENVYALYEGYLLEEYLKDLYLPAKDCNELDEEVQDYFDEAVRTLNQMRNYLHSIEGIDILEKHALQLKETIHNMEEDLTTKKVLKKMRKKVVKSSKFLSSNIDTYCSATRKYEEIKELDTMYLDKVMDPNS